MDHMQSEYLEEADNQESVQMEMVVESEDQSNSEMHVMSILPDGEESSKESHENGRTIRRGDKKSAKLLVDIAYRRINIHCSWLKVRCLQFTLQLLMMF